MLAEVKELRDRLGTSKVWLKDDGVDGGMDGLLFRSYCDFPSC